MKIIEPTLAQYPMLRKLLTVRYLEQNQIDAVDYSERKQVYDHITKELSLIRPKDSLMVERCHKAIGFAELLGNNIEDFFVNAEDDIRKHLLEAIVEKVRKENHPWVSTRLDLLDLGFKGNGIKYYPI